MLYNEINTANIEGINNYIVTIKPIVKGAFGGGFAGTTVGNRWGENGVMKGVMNDKEISLPLGIQLTNPGSIEGVNAVASAVGGFLDDMVGGNLKAAAKNANRKDDADKFNKYSDRYQGGKSFLSGAFKTLQKATGMDLKDMQPQYSVVKPDGYVKPSISFKCTFYKGMNIGGYVVSSFKDFVVQLAGATFPDEVGVGLMSFLTSPQLTYDSYLQLATVGLAKGGRQDADTTKNFGFSVSVGKILQVNNVWMKDAKISAPTVFDSKGQPLVWDVDFEFEYWRQPTYEDIKKWIMVQ